MILIETTLPDKESANKLTNILLEKKLCACIHMSQIESSYIWQGKIEHSPEILLKIKTLKELIKPIEETIKNNHPYEIPEIIATEIIYAEDKYKNWVKTSLKS